MHITCRIVLLSSLVVCFFSVPYILYAESPTVTLPSTTSLTTGAAETAAREKIDAEKARATLLSDITKLGNSPTVSQIEAFCKNQKGTADANNLGWNNGSLYTSCINWADTERNRFNVEGPSACKSGSGDPSTGIFTCDEKYSAADIATARAAVTAAKNSFINEAQKVSVPAQKVQSAQLAYDSCIAENPTNPSTACADQKKALDSAKVASEVAASAANEARDETECSFTNLGSWFSYCIRDGAQWLIKVVLVGLIAAPVLGASGAFFDLVLRISIVNFSDMLGLVDATSSTDSTIYATWVIVRNLFNIIILFQLLKIAIEKIIGRSLGKDKGDLKQKLVAIIIFSLLTNFSFFFTKAMIDLSNIVALQFYAGLGASPTDATGSILKGSISIAIVDSLGIGTAKILQTTGAIERGSATGVLTDATTPLIDIGGGKTGTIYDTFTGSIVVFCLLMLAAFILVQGAMIFLSRAVVLVFLIVLSPLMFAGGIMGFVDKWSKEWWKKLTEQLFVAPLYLAMLFVTLKVAGNGTEAGLLKSLQGVTGSSNVGFFSEIAIMLVQGIVMGGLFIACVKIAKDFGGAAAQKSSAWGAKLYGATVGGVGGYALRKSVGRFGASVTTGKWGESLQNAKQQGGLRGVLANSVLTVGTGASNSSFDMRKGLGASVKKINGIAGTKLDISSLGESKSKGFYDDTVAETKKRKEEREKAAKKATEIRATANETADEKKARESANIERVSTYGKVIEYKRDASGDIVTEKRMVDKKDLLGNAIMIDKRDANGNIVLDANGKPVKVAAQEERTVPVEKRDSKGNLIFMDDMFTKNITKPVSNSLAFITGERSQTNINEDVTKTATKAATAARKKRVAEARIEAQNKIFEKFGFTKDGDLKTFTELEQAIKADIEETDKEIEAIKNKGQKIKTGTKKVPKYVNGRLIPGQESEEDIFEYDLDDIQKQKIAELEQKKRVTGVARDKAKKWHDNQNDSKTWAGEDKKEDKKKEDKSKEDSK